MRIHRISKTQVLPIALEDAWNFFASPANLPKITPPWLNLRPTSEFPEEMHPGLIVTYDVAPFPGLKVNWVTEIAHIVPGTLFVDEQRAGPYRFWHHQHHFRPVPAGTEMRDIVHYALPFGLIGDLVAGRMVRKRVRAIFDYRTTVLSEQFGTARTPRRSGSNDKGPPLQAPA
jgi:ligand-binding SRPBCC domain-containing protein